MPEIDLCPWCGRPEQPDLPVYHVSDEEGWQRLAEQHDPGCEFVVTRCWQRPLPAAAEGAAGV